MGWQIGALLACVSIAWGVARLLQWRAPEGAPSSLRLSATGIRRIVSPMLATALLIFARSWLGYWYRVHLLSVAIPLFGSLAGIRFAAYLLRLAIPTGSWLHASERAIATVVWCVVALHITGLLPEMVRLLQHMRIPFGSQKLSLWQLLQTAFWVVAALLLSLWIGSALEARLMRAQGMHASLRVVLARLGKALLVVVAMLIVLPLLGIDLTVLSVFGGALGVGLGLGLQKIASNYLSGFIILLDRSIRIGDLITADGHHGEVKQITTRYAVVRALTGVEAIIPNDMLVTTTVLNHSYTDKKVRVALKVQVAYDTDVEQTLPLLVEIAARHQRVLRDPAPAGQLTEFADSGINLELGFWIDDPENGTLNVRSDIARQMLSEFRIRGIEIPFPQREVRLLGANAAGPCA
ncbi:MAG TPA: mechanosensitive ion channel domain-containing protein [Burkholderiales bacterium]|nr:mechanosensitive ion channel domain-containing protein [Burkholderiales bacterium]